MPIFIPKEIKTEIRENSIRFKVTDSAIVKNSEIIDEVTINDKGINYQFDISDEWISGEHFARVKSMYHNTSAAESAIRVDEHADDCYMIMSSSNRELTSSDLSQYNKSTYWFGMALYPEIRNYVFGSPDPKDAGKTKDDFAEELVSEGKKLLRKLGDPAKSNNYKKEAIKRYKARNNGNEPKPPFAKKGVKL